MTAAPAAYTVEAYNVSHASENKIHDDTVASKFGFTGGLVPGVDVFAYLAHMPMAQWGESWLSGGFMQARFVKPVYDGDTAAVTSQPQDGGLLLSISARGDLCASGAARPKGAAAPAKPLAPGPKADSGTSVAVCTACSPGTWVWYWSNPK